MTREQLLEGIARAVALHIYRSEGLETMNYMGENDYANREWTHYQSQAQAVLDYISPMLREVVEASKPMVAHSKNYFTMLRGMHEYPEYQYVANECATFEQALTQLECFVKGGVE